MLQKIGTITTVSFNRPEAMNSLNDVMAAELVKTMRDIAVDKHCRVVILKGEGNLFMAGGDINFFHQNIADLESVTKDVISNAHHAIDIMHRSDKLFIASVHGSAAGIGLSFMLGTDLVIAANDTKFTFAYSKLGVSPDGGATYHLPRSLGLKRSMQLMLTSEVFDAQQAFDYGLINWLVSKEELTDKTNQLAQQFATGPKHAYGEIKGLLSQSLQNCWKTQLDAERQAFIDAVRTHDFKIGVEAFLNKQPPEFTGK